ncbi:MAG: TonB-dependent receptor [Rikenellaceae bacterium]|nr:TonB-dependent receptor [Rikenellaceae bacterium]
MRKFLAMCLGMMLLGIVTPHLALAQGKYEVKGVVVDATGIPVIGATVIEAGTVNGTTTDLDGQYVLNVKDANSVIQISYIGYKTVELAASSSLLKNLTLEEDLMTLDEVVVIGYGGVKKSDMTGSVVAIKAEDVNRGAVTSPDQLLLGKVPGLLVTPASGEPGTGAAIRIRGNASLNASNDPLIVIDGVPVTGDGGAGMGNPLATVNPDDIDTYTVLKDASATAIYGSRASNGVIIITTKKGKGKQLQVSYNSSYTVKTNSDEIDVMSGTEFANYLTNHYNAGNDSDNAKIQSLLGYNGKVYNTDWQDLIYRTAFATDHALSVYGNNEKGTFPYRVSVGANYDQGTVEGGDNTRLNANVNLAPKFLDDHLTVNINVKGVYNKANWTNNAVYDALTYDPTKPVHFLNADGSVNYGLANGYFNHGNFDDQGNFQPETNANTNPMSSLNDYVNYSSTWRSIGNVQLDYKIHGLEDLRLNLNLGYDLSESRGTNYNKLGSFANIKAGSEDAYTNWRNYNANTLLEFYANYNKELGIHRLDVMAGYSWQRNYVKTQSISYYNSNRDEYTTGSSTEDARRPYPKEYYLVSFFGRINYAIDSRYLFTFTLRNDGTSRFSEDNRWGLFPSAAFAWNIAQEKFLQDSKTLSALKLRLGWGQTGQQDIGSNYYPYFPLYNYVNNGNAQYMPGIGGTLAPQAFNRNIKWETTTTYNAGIDFGFLQGRINGAVDYYYRQTEDLLSEIDVPTGSNFTNRLMSNIGEMKNQGVEVSLNLIPVQTEDWNLTINLNGTWQQTEIGDLNDNFVKVGSSLSGTGGNSSVHYKGFAPYTFYLYQQAYDANGKPIKDTFIDRNGDGQISEDDKYITGRSATPDFYYGLSVQLNYKNWDFGFNGHGSIGNYAINKLAIDNMSTYVGTLSYNYLRNLNEYNFRTGFTGATTTDQAYSDLFIENASFFRLDDINLGYTFREVGKSKMNIRVAASCQNVFTITDYSGLDPEMNNNDGVYSTLIPRPRLYTLRLNINF